MFSEKGLPVASMALKLKITDLVSEIESSAKAAFGACGSLMLKGKSISSKATLIE